MLTLNIISSLFPPMNDVLYPDNSYLLLRGSTRCRILYFYKNILFSSSSSSSLSIFPCLPHCFKDVRYLTGSNPKLLGKGMVTFAFPCLLINFDIQLQIDSHIGRILHGLAPPHSLTFPTGLLFLCIWPAFLCPSPTLALGSLPVVLGIGLS